MTNDKKYSDSDFDNFLKEKVNHGKLASSDDFDRFCSKLELTGFFEEKKSRRYFWFFFPVFILIIAGTTMYFYTPESERHTIPADTVIQSYGETEPIRSVNDHNVLQMKKDTPENKKVAIGKENLLGNNSIDSLVLIFETPIEKDSVLSETPKIIQKEATEISLPFSVRKEYRMEVDTIVEVDSQRVSKRKLNKKNK